MGSGEIYDVIGYGDKVYLGRAVRVIDADEQSAAIASLAEKYPQMGAARDPDAPLPHFWLFRIEPAV